MVPMVDFEDSPAHTMAAGYYGKLTTNPYMSVRVIGSERRPIAVCFGAEHGAALVVSKVALRRVGVTSGVLFCIFQEWPPQYEIP